MKINLGLPGQYKKDFRFLQANIGDLMIFMTLLQGHFIIMTIAELVPSTVIFLKKKRQDNKIK